MEIRWKWEHRPPSAIVIGSMRREGYQVRIVSYPPLHAVCESHFLIAEISAPGKPMRYRLHATKSEVRSTYGNFFDTSRLNFGLCYEEQE